MDDLFSRNEILGGLPARKANTLLFLIECRTARLITQSKQNTDFYTEKTVEELDLAFLDAFTLGQQLSLHPTIQDLEQYAPQWADLVPQNNPRIQAALAHLLGQRYRFTHRVIPGIKDALHLEDAGVMQAHQRLYHQPLDGIFLPSLKPQERLRWTLAHAAQWLESLPPFWLAFAFTITANFSQGALALPIAVAGVGALPGLALLGLVGILNILTIACMAESVARSGTIRYGNVFLGRLVTDYLGNAAALVLILAVIILGVLGLLAASVGLSVTLENFTGAPSGIWTLLLLLAVLHHLWREANKFGVATMMTLGTLSIGLVLLLGLLALPRLQPANLFYTNLPWGHDAFDPAVLTSLLGGVLVGFQGSSRVPHCAKMVFSRDPSGRSLIWGSMAGTAGTIALLGFWLLAVNGAVSPATLMTQRGTAFDPLVTVVGPVVRILGSITVCLLLGLAALRTADILFNLVRERLPRTSPAIAVLQLVKQGITDVSAIANQTGQSEDSVRHSMATLIESGLVAQPAPVRLTAESWHTSYEQSAGQSLSQSKPSSDPQPPAQSPGQIPGQPRWHARALSSHLAAILLSRTGRFCLCASPVILIFLIALLLLIAEIGSFSRILSVIGVIAVSLISGIFPVLLLASSRQKGEVIPATRLPFLSHPLFTSAIYLLFLANLFLHGFFLWQHPLERFAAVTVGFLVLIVTSIMVRKGAFVPRIVVELREDEGDREQSCFAITVRGQPLVADVHLTYLQGENHYSSATEQVPSFSSLATATVQFPSTLPLTTAQEIKIWVHRVTREGNSEGVTASLVMCSQGHKREFDLHASRGYLVVPLANRAEWLKITLAHP